MTTKTVERKLEKSALRNDQRKALPDGWRWVKLGEVSKLQSGYAFKSKWFTTEGIRLLRNANVTPGKINWDDTVYLPVESAPEFQAYKLDAGDIVLSLDRPIISSGLKVARLSQEDIPSLLLQRVGRFQTSNSLISDYLYFFLNSRLFIDSITGHDQSIGVPHISPKQVEAVKFPLPPIVEQKRIVAILSDRIAAVEQARLASQAQLAAAQALPAAYLRQIFNSPEAQKWKKKKLGDVCNRITDGTHQPPGFTDEGISFIFVKNIVSGNIDFSETNFVSQETYEELTKRCRPERDDILYSAVGSFGVAVVIETDQPFTFQRHIAHLKPNKNLINSRFIAYFLNSNEGKAMSDTAALGGAQRTVTLTALKNFKIPIPELSLQVQIASQLDDKIKSCSQVKTTIKDQLDAINALPAALLRQAFNGEL